MRSDWSAAKVMRIQARLASGRMKLHDHLRVMLNLFKPRDIWHGTRVLCRAVKYKLLTPEYLNIVFEHVKGDPSTSGTLLLACEGYPYRPALNDVSIYLIKCGARAIHEMNVIGIVNILTTRYHSYSDYKYVGGVIFQHVADKYPELIEERKNCWLWYECCKRNRRNMQVINTLIHVHGAKLPTEASLYCDFEWDDEYRQMAVTKTEFDILTIMSQIGYDPAMFSKFIYKFCPQRRTHYNRHARSRFVDMIDFCGLPPEILDDCSQFAY